MNQLVPLNTQELTQWLTRLTQTVDRSLREPNRAAANALLRNGLEDGSRLGLPVLIQLAFLSDCLRVAHLAINADGKVQRGELERVTPLVRVAASKYCFALPSYESFGDTLAELTESDVDVREINRFLATHGKDRERFGQGAQDQWIGLQLARLVEQTTHNPGPLQDHESMLVRVMDAVFDGRATDDERKARRRLRDLFEQRGPAKGSDPREIAFCRSDGPEVFSSIAHGAHIHEADQFDVEAIHADARTTFHQVLERATTPEHARRGQGRLLLVLGDSGAGKTHLLRALRAQTHHRRLGYVGYLQLTPDVTDYPRYVLRNLIDSLERPYDAPLLAESGLMYLSDGLVEAREILSPDDLERLRTAELTSAELEQLVGRAVDAVVRSEGLESLETDLVHALLLLQRRDPALQRRVVRFLRCEALSSYDREILGGIAARDRAEDPMRTIKQLATIMHELQLAALVIIVDQVEDISPDGKDVARLQLALDAMRAIADAIPSAIVVLSFLLDVYSAVKPRLVQSLIDRLERDEIRLVTGRQPDEIAEMLVKRLEHLYNFFDVAWREDDPLFPFTAAQINAVSQLRTRDCLGAFRAFHSACIAAGKVVVDSKPPAAPLPPPPPKVDDLDRKWREALATPRELASDAQLIALVGEALRGAGVEQDREVNVRMLSAKGGAGILVEGKDVPRQLIMMCNGRSQGGRFGIQIAELRALASTEQARPVALRSGEIKFLPKSKASSLLGELVADRGVALALTEADVCTAMAMRALAESKPVDLLAWRMSRKPLSEMELVRQLLKLDAPIQAAKPPESVVDRSPERPRTPTPPPVQMTQPIPAGRLRLGVTDSFRADPILLSLEDIKTHVAFLGSTGSGKTTAALSVAEQVLELGVSVLMVDRKGDLANYANDGWWHDKSAPEDAQRRKHALRAQIDLALFTPGNAQGRPLRLPLVPSLVDIKPQDREPLARFASEGLATMMGYGKAAAHKAKTSVLQCAIMLHATQRDISLDMLLETISRPDPDLLNLVGSLQRHFASLAEDLQTLLIQRGSLLSGDGEPLEIASLLPEPGHGKPRLSIINTSALTEVPVLQFWISRLLVELSRLGRKRPSPTLQAAVFLDEADTYIPASREPPTKEPMFDLLRRARSTGIGVLLATQNPGDFDYKARDNINTWLLGRIAQDRAIEKMKNLIGPYPDVGPRLAAQRTGSFFLLTGTTKRELKADRSMMETVQVSEAEVAELARKTR